MDRARKRKAWREAEFGRELDRGSAVQQSCALGFWVSDGRSLVV